MNWRGLVFFWGAFFALSDGLLATELIGHRGARGEAPENTLRGFRWALKHGVTLLEIDLYLTKDGVPVVIHDDTVDRTTDGVGPVNSFTFEDIRKLNAAVGWGDQTEKVPSVEESLLLAKEAGCRVILDLKVEGLAAPVAEIVRRVNFPMDRLETLCWNNAQVADFRAALPDVRRLFIMGGQPRQVTPEIAASVRNLGVAGFFFWPTVIEPEDVQKMHDFGLRAYYTLLASKDLLPLVEMGADGILVDSPRANSLFYRGQCWAKFREHSVCCPDPDQMEADANADGVPDVINFAFGSAKYEEPRYNAESRTISVRVTRQPWHRLAPFRLTVERSSNLVDWTSTPVPIGSANAVVLRAEEALGYYRFRLAWLSR